MFALEQRHVIPAPRERVFAALTRPEDLATWFGPEGFTIPDVTLDLRVGGTYRITMQPPDGAPFHLIGEFRRVEPPARIAYTFVWDPPTVDDRETVATLELTDQGNETEVLLTQGAFATEERLALHEAGWTESLAKLGRLLEAGS